MNCKRKIIGFLLSICMLVPVFGIMVHAASGSVSVSGASGNVGSTVTITCTTTCSTGPIGTADVVLQYNPANLQYVSGTGGYSLTGGSGSVSYKGLTASGTDKSLSFTVKFKILKEGSHKVSVSSASAYDINEALFTPSYGSGTITGKAQTTQQPTTPTNPTNPTTPAKDSNSKLSNLQVNPGTLSPAFAAGTTTYNINVPETTKDVTISATPQSNKATVSVSGGKDLKLGANTARVTVVAENGSSTVYTLNIMCGEEAKITIGGVEYKIDEAFTDEQIPTGFMRNKVLYEGREYVALKSEKGNMQLLNLKSESGRGGLVIYDEEAKECHPFKQVMFESGRFVIPVQLQDNIKAFENHERINIEISGNPYEAWKLSEEYSVICAMDSDGEIELYQYDTLDGTLQRFSGDVVINVSEQEPEETAKSPIDKVLDVVSKYHLYILAGLVLALVAVAVAFICYAVQKREQAMIAGQVAPIQTGKKHPSRKHRGRRRKRRKVERTEE